MYFLRTFRLAILLRDDWSDQMQGATMLPTHLRVSEFFSSIRLTHWMQKNGRANLQTEIETSIVLRCMSLQTETMCKIFLYIQFQHRRSLPTHHHPHPQRCACSHSLPAQHRPRPQLCPCSHSSTFQTHICRHCVSVLIFFQICALSLQTRALSLLWTRAFSLFLNSCIFVFLGFSCSWSILRQQTDDVALSPTVPCWAEVLPTPSSSFSRASDPTDPLSLGFGLVGCGLYSAASCSVCGPCPSKSCCRVWKF